MLWQRHCSVEWSLEQCCAEQCWSQLEGEQSFHMEQGCSAEKQCCRAELQCCRRELELDELSKS